MYNDYSQPKPIDLFLNLAGYGVHILNLCSPQSIRCFNDLILLSLPPFRRSNTGFPARTQCPSCLSIYFCWSLFGMQHFVEVLVILQTAAVSTQSARNARLTRRHIDATSSMLEADTSKPPLEMSPSIQFTWKSYRLFQENCNQILSCSSTEVVHQRSRG